jgi:hypothetical protein
MLYRTQNLILQVILLVCVGIIGGMIYYTYTTVSDKVESGDMTITAKVKEVKDVLVETQEKEADNVKKVVTKDEFQKGVLEIKEHIPVPHPVIKGKCPSVEDIVNAIYPGRNTGVVREGRYFDLGLTDDSGDYKLMSDAGGLNPYPDYAPLDPPLRDFNVPVTQNQIDNTFGGEFADTQASASLEGSKTRMRTDDRTPSQSYDMNEDEQEVVTRMGLSLPKKDDKDTDNIVASKKPAIDRTADVEELYS